MVWIVAELARLSVQFGVIVLTTSAGIMDHEEARRKKVGGKVGPSTLLLLCSILILDTANGCHSARYIIRNELEIMLELLDVGASVSSVFQHGTSHPVRSLKWVVIICRCWDSSTRRG